MVPMQESLGSTLGVLIFFRRSQQKVGADLRVQRFALASTRGACCIAADALRNSLDLWMFAPLGAHRNTILVSLLL